MIFVTVGTQLSFDRLIEAVDAWAGENPSESVFAQVGPGQYKTRYCQSAAFVPPNQANDLFLRADLIVSHAGMGSILTAMRYRKPILVMPRRASLGEHRNEHQLATAKWLHKKAGVFVANDASDMSRLLSARSNLTSGNGISDYADVAFTDCLRDFIDMR